MSPLGLDQGPLLSVPQSSVQGREHIYHSVVVSLLLFYLGGTNFVVSCSKANGDL